MFEMINSIFSDGDYEERIAESQEGHLGKVVKNILEDNGYEIETMAKIINEEDGLSRAEFEQLTATVFSRFDFDEAGVIASQEDFTQAVVALMFKLPQGTPALKAPEVDVKCAAAWDSSGDAVEWTVTDFQDWFEHNVLLESLVG